MYCPFCKQDLEIYDTCWTMQGVKVSFECTNGECEEAEDVIFFAYVNQSDLQY